MSPWSRVETELSATAAAGGTTRFWLRDDDARDVTPTLDRLDAACERAGMPVLLAVIPSGATERLAGWCAERPGVTPCQHGWQHANHAGTGERACELGGDRADAIVLDELRQGRSAMLERFGAQTAPVLVPPWNRIRDSLLPHLHGLGYAALSTFAPAPERHGGPPELNCDVDVIDWRQGGVGRSIEELSRKLADAVAAVRGSGRPLGLLTHHLAHDAAAWAFLESFLDWAGRQPHLRFIDARTALAEPGRD